MERDLGYYTDTAINYAQQVLNGEIPACKWTKAACRRQLDDLDSFANSPEYQFDWDIGEAEHVCRFVELLPHVKGKWSGQKIKLEPWQIFILTTVFGWYGKDGYRRFRTVYIEVPRKNAKSTLSSCVALYMLTADREPGAEVYSAATTQKQAKIVFDAAKQMARKEPEFQRRFGVKVYEHSIAELLNDGLFVPLSAEGSTLDGLNLHFGCVDELHAHKTRAVYDVLETATGARTQPMLWNITTAGSDRGGICYEQRSYLSSILNNTLLKHGGLGYQVKGSASFDDSYFGVIYTIDEGDEWTDERAWAKANPNYNISVYPDDIKRLAKKAIKLSAARNNFLTKRLDVWVNAAEAWMDMLKWEACIDHSISIDDFAGEKCWIGMDLAEKSDFAAIVATFWRNGSLYVFPKLYLNDAAIDGSDNSQFEGWREDGYIIGNDGDVTDFDQIASDLIYFHRRFDLQEIPFDPALSRYFATKLINDHSLPLIEMRQNGVTFTSAVTELENLVLEKKLKFDGNPALTWMMSNVVIKESRFSGLKHPTKEGAANKIDGIIALLMALSRAVFDEDRGNINDFINEPIYG